MGFAKYNIFFFLNISSSHIFNGKREKKEDPLSIQEWKKLEWNEFLFLLGIREQFNISD